MRLLLIVSSLLVFIFFTTNLAAQELPQISGANHATYIYRTAADSLHSFFNDEFNFSINYRKFTYGMQFHAKLPKYDDFKQTNELKADEVAIEWDERYLEYEGDNLLLHAGTFTDLFGKGVAFRSYEEEDFNWDSRLEGLLAKYEIGKLNSKAFYGSLPNQAQDTKNDVAYGTDWQYRANSALTLGANAVTIREWQPTDKYNQRDVFTGRASWNPGMFEIWTESGISQLYHRVGRTVNGSAIYAEGNAYLGSLTITSAYKRYKNFNYRLHDLPLANYSNETLADNIETGHQEEGLMGEVNYTTPQGLSILANYSEAWALNDDVHMSDFFGSATNNNGPLQWSAEYAQIEKINDDSGIYSKELTPAMSFDYSAWHTPLHTRFEYQYKEKKFLDTKQWHYEPLAMLDVTLPLVSVSVQAETEIQGIDDLTDAKYWLGTELKTNITKQTDLTVFAGKEKGGKICRHGVCRYRAAFEGVRVELHTSF